MRKHLPPFLLGFLALSFQIYLLREFSVHFYGNEITFGFILASWFLWGGVGSLFASRIKWDISRIPYIYYLVILVFPVCLVLLRFSRFFLHTLPGEITGITPMLFFSLGLSLIISFPLGALFVFNAIFLKGNVTQVYLMESLGSAVAGIAVYFFFIPAFSNWQATAIIGAIVSLMVFLFLHKRNQIFCFLFILLFLAAFWVFDLPSQKIHWKPFEIIESMDTPFGKLQVIQTKEMLSLYNNTLLIYSFPNLASSEESVHFALLQRPQAEKVLLIGGGAGGSLVQALKYPKTQVDYVELDPGIIRLSLKYLPQQERDSLKDTRVQIYFQDGRAFLKKTPDTYDAIILNLPDPSTAQINRFYTKEFFSQVKRKLAPDGIFSFRVSSAENYISDELQNFLASLYFTLNEVFPEIEIVPGDSNIFLASSAPISLDHQELSQKIDRLDLKNTYISSHSLFSRLSPFRLSLLKEKLVQGQKSINLDLVPISYYYNSVLWNSQFQGLESSLFRLTSRLGRFWLLDAPLIGLLLIMVLLGWRLKKSSFFLLPLAVMGLTTITVEIIMRSSSRKKKKEKRISRTSYHSVWIHPAHIRADLVAEISTPRNFLFPVSCIFGLSGRRFIHCVQSFVLEGEKKLWSRVWAGFVGVLFRCVGCILVAHPSFRIAPSCKVYFVGQLLLLYLPPLGTKIPLIQTAWIIYSPRPSAPPCH
jgi:spermidine synthase